MSRRVAGWHAAGIVSAKSNLRLIAFAGLSATEPHVLALFVGGSVLTPDEQNQSQAACQPISIWGALKGLRAFNGHQQVVTILLELALASFQMRCARFFAAVCA